MRLNPRIYEIYTRVWIKRFGKDAKLTQPAVIKYFEELAGKGINIIWLMGIWKTCSSLIDKCCFNVDLIAAYNNSLGSWNKEDVIGSPYSIDVYDVNPEIGTRDELVALKEILNKMGLKLILDFVPNHFGADSKMLESNPEIFLPGDEELKQRDELTFFESFTGRIFAHGRDPLFPPWTDTIQLNYFEEETRSFMTNMLLNIAGLCDGVRCDMAMLPLNNIFHNTWLGVINKFGFSKPTNEFWKPAILKVKDKFPGFIFIGEAYWDLEWQLQQLGFDFTYDKKLTDRLAGNDIAGVKAHLSADKEYQCKSVRFLENHDEQRAFSKFGEFKSLASAVVISTIQGMKLYYDGQFEGKKIKLPVQLGREPFEKVSVEIKKFYDNILKITNDEIFRSGEWSLLDPVPAADGNESNGNFFAWQWKKNGKIRIIVINYSEKTSQCRIRFNSEALKEKIILKDLLTGAKYIRSCDEINSSGLFIELKGYNSHIFEINN